jgi:hypothetical protein
MSNERSPEEWAEELVRVAAGEPGGPWTVELRGLLPEPVVLNRHPNPALVQEDAERIKAYLAALIREVRQDGHSSLKVFHPKTEGTS